MRGAYAAFKARDTRTFPRPQGRRYIHAIRLAKEFDIDYVIIHATEGHLIADELLEDNARTIVGPVISERCKPELRNHTIETAGVLNKAGVPMCICTDHPVVPEQYLPLSAGLAVRGGLNRNEAAESDYDISCRNHGNRRQE